MSDLYDGFGNKTELSEDVDKLKQDLTNFASGTNVTIPISGEGTVKYSINFFKGYKYIITNSTSAYSGNITLTADDGSTNNIGYIANSKSKEFIADKHYTLMTFYSNASGLFSIVGDGIVNLIEDLKEDCNERSKLAINISSFVWKMHDGNQRIKSYPVFVHNGDTIIGIESTLQTIINIYSDYYRAKTIYDGDGSYGVNGDIYASSDWKTGKTDIVIPASGYLILRAIGRNTDTVSKIELVTTHNQPQIVEENKEALVYISSSKRRYCIGEGDAKNRPYITTFAHFSDVHGNSTSVQRVIDFCNASPFVDDIICTGDIVRDHFSEGTGFWDFIDGSERILTVIGNHDAVIDSSNWKNLVTQAERYNTFISPYASNWNATVVENKSYYYKDYATSKLRLVVLDCMLTSDEATEQNTWLASTLSSAKSLGYSVIIGEHYPPANAVKIDCTFTNAIRAIQSYNVLSVTYQHTVQSFIDDGGNFVCYLAGHTHNDQILYNADYPNQIFIMVDTSDFGTNAETYSDTGRTYGKKSQDLFNIVSVDTYAKLIKIIRIGADKDCLMRSKKVVTISYTDNTVIANY